MVPAIGPSVGETSASPKAPPAKARIAAPAIRNRRLSEVNAPIAHPRARHYHEPCRGDNNQRSRWSTRTRLAQAERHEVPLCSGMERRTLSPPGLRPFQDFLQGSETEG